MTIRLDVEHPAILDHFPFFREVHNFINISVFKQFQLLKIEIKLLLLNVSWKSSDISKIFGE